MRRTETHARSLDPVWDEVFEFDGRGVGSAMGVSTTHSLAQPTTFSLATGPTYRSPTLLPCSNPTPTLTPNPNPNPNPIPNPNPNPNPNQVGRHILSITQGAELDANPYKQWIQTYGGEDFEAATFRAVGALDALAAAATPAVREEMLRAFRQAARFEYLFWDSAYRREQWPVPL